MNKERISSICLTPFLSGVIKKFIAFPRYKLQLRVCRKGYSSYEALYRQKILFVAGLPKSGTTWLEKMLFSLPGFHEIMIPEAVYYEQKNGGSHDFNIPENTISRLNRSLAVLKLHVHGSINNVLVLEKAKINYVVIFRDLRDVAVSYFYYVRNTPWHPEHKRYMRLPTVQDGLMEFGKVLLPAYKEWVDSWQLNGTGRCMIVRYEDMRADTFNVFSRILGHFQIDLSEDEIKSIIEENSFKALTKGRKEGQDDSSSFFRKGVTGDWKNHFNDDLKDLYKAEIGDFLIKNGYEKDLNW
ncbi:sulfotransferase domain-containing protein [Cyclobacterium xiamenense]|uniref:sulfotransferase domain-containing protein n=1 Tax=Cyclobacterium xiamenense TaxID=1297121 RepID=UPI0035CFD090